MRKPAEIILEFNSISRQLDDLLNIDNPDFEGRVKRIYSIPSSDFNLYLKQIKVVLFTVKNIVFFH